MARKRGFLAEYQRQMRLTEQRQRQRAQLVARAERERQAAIRKAEQQRRAAERAELAAARLSEQERRKQEREALAAHQANMQAEVDDLNAALAEAQAELESILSSTLDVDDFVDLESLRVKASHPPFAHEHLRVPTSPPPHVPDPPRPEPEAPKNAFSLFNKKKKQEEAELAAAEAHRLALQQWEHDLQELSQWRAKADATYRDLEEKRQRELANALESYRNECAARDREASERNKELDDLIVGLGYGVPDAVNEYISIVLANSVYPENFEVDHTATFEPSGAELTLNMRIPGPDTFETTKSYRYVKAADEITATALSQKDQKDRYTSIVNAVALRTLHEVFEADRRGVIQSIALELGTETRSPATGQFAYVPLLGVATDRAAFEEIDLSAVVPAATLQHLNAVVSKNPFALTPANLSGVRKG